MLAAACGPQPAPPPDVATATIEQPLTGQAGALSVTTANTVVNQYGVLAANVAAGATTITITSAADFPAAGAFTTTLASGDLLMLYQPQGATISGANSAAFGTVTGLRGAGNYELVHVASVAGTTITLEAACGGLKNAYTTAGATEVIRIPQATTLTISGAGSLTATAWDGARGGVLAVQAQTTMTIGGAGIDTSGEGFRGGAVDNVTTGPPGTATIRSNSDATGAEKGESIAGYEALYDSADNGRYGRGAPANGGGGGDAHNGGGGGGANGDNGSAYTGAGVMSAGVTGAGAWAVDPDDMANGGPTTSSGGGRGGYSFADAAADPLTVGPGSATWGGDDRRDVGGLGGRPLANDPTARLFLGGGGGAGDGNNNVAGPGGAGGGLIFLIADSVTGTAAITSDGGNGGNSAGNPGDAPGGAGAGGTIIVAANTLTGVALHADGGAGGNQTQAAVDEAEGPGGGGGGGYIAVTGGTPVQTAAGALGGTTNSPTMTAFPSDGATSGATGVTNAAATGLLVCTPDDLQLTVTDGVTTIAAGSPDTYTIVVTNAGADVLAGATVTDTLPAALTGVTWTCVASAGSTCPASGTGALASTVVKLAPGGTVTFTVKGTIDPAATGTLAVTGTVAAPAGVTDTTPANNTATDTDTLTASADLSITVTDSPDPVAASGALTYTVTVTNAGPSNASGLTMTDTLPAGVMFGTAVGTGWACSAAGQVVTCTRAALTVTTAPVITITTTAPPATGTITDTATIAETTPDPTAGNNTATQQTTVGASSDLSVTINDTPDPVPAGGTETYTVTVTNSGPSPAQTVTVTDTLPAGVTFVSASGPGWACAPNAADTVVTCTIATLAAGTSVISIVVTAPPTPGSITNTATATSTTPDPTPGNNTGTATTTVAASADLSIAITDSPDPVLPGGTLTYTVAVANAGPSPAAGVTVTDTLPAGITLVSDAGTGWACTNAGLVVTCTRAAAAVGAQPPIAIVVTAPPASGTITDHASVGATTADPQLANNIASQDTTVSASADLGVTVTGAPDPVAAGGTLTYTVIVTNGGPGTASTVSVVDTLPAGATLVSDTSPGWTCTNAGQVVTCTRPTAAPGAQPPITIAVTAPPTAGSITDSVTVSAATADPTTTNNSATDTTSVNASADLSIGITDAPDPVATGAGLVYTITVTNSGPSTATGISVTDTLPAGVMFVSASGTGWTCAQGGSTVVCTAGTGASGPLPPIAIMVGAPVIPGPITDAATVTSSTADPNPANNSATQTTTVSGSADLSVALTESPDPVVAGAALTYGVAVTNNGTSLAAGVTVTDTLPTGVAFTSAAGTGWTCGNAGQVVTCTTPTLSIGTAPAIGILAIAPGAGGTITDTVTAGALTPDPDLTNNTATLDTDVTASADLGVTIGASPDPVAAGGTLTYTITPVDNGPSPAGTITITDTLPAGATFVSASGTGWTCSAAGQVVTCTAPAGGPGAIPTVTIVATAPPGGGMITDTASISSVTADPTPGNNSATITTNVTPPPTSADLAITLAAAPSPIPQGGALTYTIGVDNLGPDPSQAVSVTDTLAAGLTFVSAAGGGWTCTASGTLVTCTAATLATGPALPISIVVTATVAAGNISNTAVVASAVTPDPVAMNNTATISTEVDPAADLAITLAGAPDTVDANALITYTVGVRNNGPADAAGVVVTDTLPAGATFASATGTGWTCSGAAATVTCTLAGNLTASSNADAITITAAAPGGGGPITDTATVTATTADPNLDNNTAMITTNDNADADLAIAIDGDPSPVIIGGTVTYSIRVTDDGPSDASGVKVTNTLPPGVTIVTQPFGDGWSCFNEVCTRPTLAAGTSAEIQLAVSAPLAQTTLTDSVTVSGTATDPDLSNNSASVDVEVNDGGLGVRGGGCDAGGGSSNAGGLVLALGALGLALGRRRHLAVAGAALAALVLTAAPARAQVAGAPETFSVERMRLSIDGDGLLDVEWASVHPQWKWNVATWVGLENDPLVVYSMTSNARTESLVHNRFDGSLLGAVGLTSWLELGLQVPLIYDQSNEGTTMLPSPASPKLGDLTIAPKVLFVRGGPDATSVGMMFELTTPTGGSTGYTGPDNVSFIPELIISRPIGDLRLSGNLGYVAQPETQVLNLRVDDELFLRAGAGYRLGDADPGERKPLELDVTYSMATAAAHPFAHVNADSYELDGALGYDVTREVTLYGLSGAGIGAGFGSPDWRVVLGARYSRREAKQRLDRDGDGIYDDEDKCPDEPEDKDGFQDEDGCPDLDNDNDGIPDAQDKCPNDPEDKDGFQDADGCPDPDNDQDGVPDVKDKCPNEPEDTDGFQDEDGCPDPDNDQDGVLDVDDKCPLQPGPKENGGCPDPDRDGDGVVDRLDNCPDVPGKPENAGCPDKQLVKINGDKLEIIESVYFKLDKAVIEKRSYKLLDNVAAVINSHPALVIQVEGHTDSQGKPAYNKDLSQRRAQAVADYLAGKGVDPAHLKPVGFGQDRPIADNKTATGRAQNRRVVFTIVGGADGTNIQNKQQGADDSTKEIEMDGK